MGLCFQIMCWFSKKGRLSVNVAMKIMNLIDSVQNVNKEYY